MQDDTEFRELCPKTRFCDCTHCSTSFIASVSLPVPFHVSANLFMLVSVEVPNVQDLRVGLPKVFSYTLRCQGVSVASIAAQQDGELPAYSDEPAHRCQCLRHSHVPALCALAVESFAAWPRSSFLSTLRMALCALSACAAAGAGRRNYGPRRSEGALEGTLLWHSGKTREETVGETNALHEAENKLTAGHSKI